MKNSRIKILISLFGLAVVLLIITAFRESEDLRKSLLSIRNADMRFVGLALASVLFTYLFAALTLKIVSLRKLHYARTLLVQLASGLATKLVPAGLGGIALNVRYLQRQRHSLVQAGSVIAINNSLGFLGHVCIILVTVLVGVSGPLNVQMPSWFATASVGAFLMIFSLLILWNKTRRTIASLWQQFVKAMHLFQKSPEKLLAGFFTASLITLFFAVCLWSCAQALGVTLSPIQVLWALTFGLIGSAVSPTPGGVGGAEAALTAALVSIHIEFENALSIALLFRLLTYWLPMFPGLIAFYIVLKRKII